MIARTAIAAAAESYLGCPYRARGRSRDGLDCVGLLVVVSRDVGYDVSAADIPDYPDTPDGRLMPLFAAFLRRISDRDATTGSVVVFTDGPSPCHAGIITAPHGAYVHSHVRKGLVVRGTVAGQIGHGTLAERRRRAAAGGMRACAFYDLPGVTDG